MQKNLRTRFLVDKLVRDRSVGIKEDTDITGSYYKMDKPEYVKRLDDKLLEEAFEVIAAQNKNEITEELADLMEVIFAIAEANEILMKELEDKRLAKKGTKGGFNSQIYNRYVEMSNDNPSIKYFLERPKKYPVIS